MTRNLYLGSSLAPAIGIDPAAPDAGLKFVGAVAEIYGTSVFTDFPTRATEIAAEIAETKPDLVGLQEVSRWTAQSGVPTDAANNAAAAA